MFASCFQYSFLYLWQLKKQHSFLLAFSDSISVYYYIMWKASVSLFKNIQGFTDKFLQRVRYFLAFFLEFSIWPISSNSLVDTSCESKNWFITIPNFVVHVHSAHHSRFIQKRHFVDCPRFTTNFGTNLDQNFITNTSNILTFTDSIRKYNLWWYWYFLYQKSF